MHVMDSRLTFLTGNSGAGKTTLCLRLIEEAQRDKYNVGGFISPPVFEAERKVGIDLLNVWTGERRRLANRLGGDKGMVTQRWQFDEAVIQWGNSVMAQRPTCALFIIDELGPLEFALGRGLLGAMTLLDERVYPDNLVVVRPVLLAYARWRWPWGTVRPPGGFSGT